MLKAALGVPFSLDPPEAVPSPDLTCHSLAPPAFGTASWALAFWLPGGLLKLEHSVLNAETAGTIRAWACAAAHVARL